jgi:hypothetical protein
MKTYFKFVRLVSPAIDQEARTVKAVITDGSVDRERDRIRPAGVAIVNDIVGLYQHEKAASVCRWTDPKLVGFVPSDPWSGSWRATAQFPESGLVPLADEVWQRVASGVLKDVSVGFIPTSPPVENAHGGLDFPSVEVVEVSWVAVPANVGAHVLAASLGRRSSEPVYIVSVLDLAEVLAGIVGALAARVVARALWL